jgi:hypothetical protein
MKRAHGHSGSEPKQESVADFKARIAAKMRGSAPEAFPLRVISRDIVRVETDRGYYPPPRDEERG